ncbi:acyltransferase [Micromonospora sp. NPDC049044]|uniref:acyltransferase family protein n=1 Tax=unclassified Micromonospora TaxID=2617518 RepID=UPI0033F91C51
MSSAVTDAPHAAAGMATAARGTKVVRLDSLTALRGVLAAMAFMVHYTALQLVAVEGGGIEFVAHAIPEWVAVVSFGGMNAFFLMSGIVLTWVVRDGDTARVFWRRRVSRIYPIYATTTAVAAVVLVVLGMPPGWKNVLSNMFMVQGWVPQQSVIYGLNPVSWSLSAEAFFYLIFPVLFAALVPLGDRALRRVIVVATLLACTLPFLVGDMFLVKDAGPPFFDTAPSGGDFAYWFTMVLPLHRALDFTVGVAVGLLLRRGTWRGPGVPGCLAILVAAFAVTLLLPERVQRVGALLIPVAILLAALATADAKGGRSVLHARPIVWFGEISYSFYLTHLLVFLPLGPVVTDLLVAAGVIGSSAEQPPLPVELATIVCLFALCTTVAWLLYRFVELPAARLLRPKPASVREAVGKPGPERHNDPEVLAEPLVGAGSTTGPKSAVERGSTVDGQPVADVVPAQPSGTGR